MSSAIKTMVSKNKNRYVSDGFNLDLSYITDRLIAMGFPAEKFESIYRNSSDEVKRFLDEKHPHHYKIYNLCSERIYDPSKFHGRVAHYPFDDHHPPRFRQIQTFCDDVTEWLARHQNNVAAVHCKAGKGRTGVMVCCFLLHSKVYATAAEVLNYYGRQRTQNDKGVTIPSQQRYINYYDVCLGRNLRYESVKMYLTTVVVDHVPSFGNTDTYQLQFEVHSPAVRATPYASEWQQMKAKERLVRLEVDPPLLVSDDVKIEFSYKGLIIKPKLLMAPKKEFHFWINTFFFNKDFGEAGGGGATTTTNLVGMTQQPPQPPPTTEHDEERRQVGATSCGEKLNYDLDMDVSVESASAAEPLERKSSNESDGLCKEQRRPELTHRGATCPKSSSCVKESDLTSAAATASSATCPKNSSCVKELELTSAAAAAARGATCLNVTSCVKDEMNGGGASASALTNLVKTTSISDDTLLLLREQQQQRLAVSFAASVEDPPPPSLSSSNTASSSSSFITERMRHSSVPQAATSGGRTARHASSSGTTTSHQHRGGGGGCSAFHSSYDHHHHPHPDLPEDDDDANANNRRSTTISVEGDKLSLRLNKLQIDKACKNRGKIYSPGFNVTLFLIRPTNQTADLLDYHAAAATSTTTRQSRTTPVKNQGGGGGGGGGEHQTLSASSSSAAATCVAAAAAAGSGGEQSSQESSSEEENNAMDSSLSSERVSSSSADPKAAAAAAATSNGRVNNHHHHTLKSRTTTTTAVRGANSISSPKTELVGGGGGCTSTRSSSQATYNDDDDAAPPPPPPPPRRRTNLTSSHHHHHHHHNNADPNQFGSINNMMLANNKTTAAVSQSTWI